MHVQSLLGRGLTTRSVLRCSAVHIILYKVYGYNMFSKAHVKSEYMDEFIKKCREFFVVCVKSSTFALAKRKQRSSLNVECVLSSVGRAIDS